MLLTGQCLRGRLPLLSAAFRHSNLRHQVPPRLHDARDPSGNYERVYCPVNLTEMTTSTPFWDLLRAAKYDIGPRFYFPSEGRRAEDFFALQIRRLRPGLNPRNRIPEASTLTPRPPKPHIYIYICHKLHYNITTYH